MIQSATRTGGDRRSILGAVGSELEDSDRADLWRRYKDEADEGARDGLILAYLPLVNRVAGQTACRMPAHVEKGDLISYAFFGLTSAIERFDPARAIKFETFALTRMRGSILDELRTLDWVPRSVRSKARNVQRANAELERRLQRAPAAVETAAALGKSVGQLQTMLMKISRSRMIALDEVGVAPDASERPSLLDTLVDPNAVDPVGELGVQESRAQLADAIEGLPRKERVVVTLCYFENRSLRESGQALGVTESRASQIRAKAILRLRSALRDECDFMPDG